MNTRQFEQKNKCDLMRENFLCKVIEINPSVISDLAKMVFPLSLSFGDLLQPKYYYLPKVISDLVKCDYDFDNELRPNQKKVDFQKAMCLWAKKYNLFDEWIFLEVLATLENWKQNGVKDKWTFAREIKILPIRGYKANESFEFVFEPYNPVIETWNDYQKRLDKKLGIQKQKYRQNRESKNQDNKAYNPQKKTHLTWLIEHQICGMTYDKIAEKDENGMELRKISEAINRLAKLIGLTLRDAPNRKKRKTKV